MRKLPFVTVVLLGLLASPVFAFHCPADMAKIDAALAENPDLSPEDLTEVKQLRAQGEALHMAGNHGESVEVLAEAMEILGID